MAVEILKCDCKKTLKQKNLITLFFEAIINYLLIGTVLIGLMSTFIKVIVNSIAKSEQKILIWFRLDLAQTFFYARRELLLVC